MLACLLGEMVNRRRGAAGGERPIDLGRAARMALVHDLAESLVTDLPREASEYIGREAKHAAEGEAMRELFAGVVGGDDYVALWQEYDSGGSPEARLVRDADKLEMVLQARHYASAGNENLAEFWQGHSWSYGVTEELFDQLTPDDE